jgi:quercetin dioxygenase-like cupin family protein
MRLRRLLVMIVCVLPAFHIAAQEKNPAPAGAELVKRTILQRADVPGTEYELLLATVELSADTIHTHQLDYLMLGQVLEGDYWIKIEGQPVQILHPGDSITIPGKARHEEGAITKPVKVIAAYLNPKGASLVNPAK